jgi:1-deoxy-D-xylulose-5-phosphate reductoisomerase
MLDRACGDPATTGDDGSVSTRTVILLGSTGSIGTQAVDVITRNPDRFTVTGLSAGGGDVGLLVRQAQQLGASTVAVADAAAGPALREALPGIEVLVGPQ